MSLVGSMRKGQALHFDQLQMQAKELLGVDPDREIDTTAFDGASAETRLLAELAVALGHALDFYEGMESELQSALEVIASRVKGERDIESAGLWVALNFPRFALAHDLKAGGSKIADGLEEAIRHARGEDVGARERVVSVHPRSPDQKTEET